MIEYGSMFLSDVEVGVSIDYYFYFAFIGPEVSYLSAVYAHYLESGKIAKDT